MIDKDGSDTGDNDDTGDTTDAVEVVDKTPAKTGPQLPAHHTLLPTTLTTNSNLPLPMTNTFIPQRLFSLATAINHTTTIEILIRPKKNWKDFFKFHRSI